MGEFNIKTLFKEEFNKGSDKLFEENYEFNKNSDISKPVEDEKSKLKRMKEELEKK